VTTEDVQPLAPWQLAARGGVLLVAVALSLLQATLVLGLLSHVAPPGFAPIDPSLYTKYAISGLPVVGLYLWSIDLSLGALRNAARPARWGYATVVAGMVATAAWLWSMLDVVA
jgi:hypothetical protein